MIRERHPCGRPHSGVIVPKPWRVPMRPSFAGWQSFASTEMEEVFQGLSSASPLVPAPLCSAICRCGQPRDSRGHQVSLRSRRGSGSPWVPVGKLCLHRSAERQARGCWSTSVSKTWISTRPRADGRREVRTVCCGQHDGQHSES